MRVIIIIRGASPFRQVLFGKLHYLYRFNLGEFFLGGRSPGGLENGWGENHFQFVGILMTEGIAASVKRGGNRVDPRGGWNVEKRRAEEVILNNKKVYHWGALVVK